MFNHEKFFALVSAALRTPHQTWISYRDSQPPINEILIGLIVPLVVGTTIAAALLSYVFGTQDIFIFGTGRSFVAMLQQIILGSILGVLATLMGAGVLLIAARLFNGSGSYPATLSAVGLASVPAWLASLPGALPGVGWLIQFIAAIYSLVLLYKVIPVFLTLEESRRALHFIVSIITILIVNMVLSLTVFGDRTTGLTASSYDAGSRASRGGAITGFGNAAALYEAAGSDRYEPPRTGEVSGEQVRNFVRAAENTAARRSAYLREASQIDDQLTDAGDSLSSLIRSVGSVSRGLNAGMGLINAEMETVKADGGNWAEHEWVRERLQSARYGFGDDGSGQQANRAIYAREQIAIERAFELLASIE